MKKVIFIKKQLLKTDLIDIMLVGLKTIEKHGIGGKEKIEKILEENKRNN